MRSLRLAIAAMMILTCCLSCGDSSAGDNTQATEPNYLAGAPNIDLSESCSDTQ